jgi:hypothetical protein
MMGREIEKMTNEQGQAERLTKAFQAAEFLASDLREAHAKADNVAEEMLLMDLLSDAHRIRDRLKRLAGARAAEVVATTPPRD